MTKCPHCGNPTAELDIFGDIECWNCGKITYATNPLPLLSECAPQARGEWQPASGYQSISGAAVLVGKSARWVWAKSKELNLTVSHDRHHAILANAQVLQLVEYAQGNANSIVWVDGVLKITTERVKEFVAYTLRWLDELPRQGIVSGVMRQVAHPRGFVSGQWLLDAVDLLGYLGRQRRSEDAERLRQGISQLCSGLCDPIVFGYLSGLPQLQSVESQNNVVESGDEIPPSHKP